MLKVALLQMLSRSTQAENLQKGLDYCRKAKAMGADIALFPEMWNIGYTFPENREALCAAAIDKDSEFVQAFVSLAGELDMAIAITYLERFSPCPRNTVMLIDRFGRLALTYAKVHTCDFDREIELTPGDGFYAADLDTAEGVVKIGAMICYDREFPESARILMFKGAEILLIPNACPMEINRLSQLRSRAFENMVGLAMANYAYGQPDCTGHSSAFDGIAYEEIRPGCVEARDMLVVEAGESEGIYMASFPIEQLRDYRGREVHGNAFRRPEIYGELLSADVHAPFIRQKRRA